MPTQSRVSLSKLTPGAISERDRIRLALDECGGNQTHAARLLGISRGTANVRLHRARRRLATALATDRMQQLKEITR